MKFQKNIFVKLMGLPLVGNYLTTRISSDVDEVIGRLLILHCKRDKRKHITLLTEMMFVGTNLG